MLTKIVLATVALASIVQVNANMAPSYPEPGTVWKTGQTYEIVWKDDKKKPSIEHDWRDFSIDLMTGDNLHQKFLMNVAKGVDGKEHKSFKFQAPEVHPPSAVYFLMFTNSKGENAWTTRFAITGDGALIAPENAKQPDGVGIPWGIGQLGKDPHGGHKVESTKGGAKPNAAHPDAAEVEAMEPEKMADHAEPEALQAILPGAIHDDMPAPGAHPSVDALAAKPQEPNTLIDETSDAIRLTQSITGLLLVCLLANLLL